MGGGGGGGDIVNRFRILYCISSTNLLAVWTDSNYAYSHQAGFL